MNKYEVRFKSGQVEVFNSLLDAKQFADCFAERLGEATFFECPATIDEIEIARKQNEQDQRETEIHTSFGQLAEMLAEVDWSKDQIRNFKSDALHRLHKTTVRQLFEDVKDSPPRLGTDTDGGAYYNAPVGHGHWARN